MHCYGTSLDFKLSLFWQVQNELAVREVQAPFIANEIEAALQIFTPIEAITMICIPVVSPEGVVRIKKAKKRVGAFGVVDWVICEDPYDVVSFAAHGFMETIFNVVFGATAVYTVYKIATDGVCMSSVKAVVHSFITLQEF